MYKVPTYMINGRPNVNAGIWEMGDSIFSHIVLGYFMEAIHRIFRDEVSLLFDQLHLPQQSST